jgi:hypothetical protein
LFEHELLQKPVVIPDQIEDRLFGIMLWAARAAGPFGSGAVIVVLNNAQKGVAGVDMGRNIFQSEAPKAMLAAVNAVVHQNMRPKEAFDLFGSLNKSR